MLAVPGMREVSDAVREVRLQSGGPRITEAHSRFRPRPSLQAGQSLDYMVRDQSQLETMWSIINQLIVDHPLVDTALKQRVAMSRIMDCNPQPRTLDPVINTALKKVFEDYAADPLACDVYRKRTFPEMSACALYLHSAHGDVCAPITEAGAIKVCEAWRMRSPNTNTRDRKWGFHGMVKNPDGQVMKYWLTKEQIDPLDPVRTQDVEPLDAYDDNGNPIFLHPMGIGRAATRGISCLAPVGDLLYMQMDLCFTQVLREQMACCTMYAEETTPEGWGILKEMVTSDPNALKDMFNVVGKTWKAAPGSRERLLPGSTLKAINAGINVANFNAINEFMILCLAVNLDCPALAITLDATKANFSQFRNVIHQSKMRFEALRSWWVPQWHKPVYEHLIRRKAAEKTPLGVQLRAYVAIHGIASLLKCDWSWPEYEYIEPVKDATADAMRRAEGLVTDEQWSSQHHAMAWIEFAQQLVTGRGQAIELYLTEKARLLSLPVCSDERLRNEVYSLPMSVLLPIPVAKKTQPELMSTMEPEPEPVPSAVDPADKKGAAA